MNNFKNVLFIVLFSSVFTSLHAQIKNNIVEILNAENPEKYKELDLSSKGLTKLPPEIGRFVNIVS
jgi:Leucine-rich repeat (LRR) protein